MVLKKKTRSWLARYPYRAFCIFVFIGGLIYGALGNTTKKPADIFVISSSLNYGDTEITGVIEKDSAIGAKGNFYLTSSDGHIIRLDSTNLDSIVGHRVKITGYLTPKQEENSLPQMAAASIVTIDQE